jgi:hypothetical protein
VTANSDFAGWTTKLRSNLMFTDGTPLDATAVMDQFSGGEVPENTSPAIGYALETASMKVVDPTTLQVTLKAPLLNTGLTLRPLVANTNLLSTSAQDTSYVNDLAIDAAMKAAQATCDVAAQTATLMNEVRGLHVCQSVERTGHVISTLLSDGRESD